MSAAAAAAPAAEKRFDGRVFHAHCDSMITAESLAFDFPGKGEMQFGVITPDIFIVINSPDLLAAVQKQLQNHMSGTYKAQSVTIQLGDAEGALGSEMLSENLATRIVQAINTIRGRACEAFREHTGQPAKPMMTVTHNTALTPTASGLRLYPKLPEVKNNASETAAKIRELAIKYGAIPGEDGEVRDLSNHNVTIKVNIFGYYRGQFYLNFRLVAPFRARDKPEILAEVKKTARKRAASSAPRKPRAPHSAAEGEEPADGECAGASAAASSAPALKRTKSEAPGAPRKRVKPAAVGDGSSVNPADFDNEDELCLAYVKSGMPLRAAAQAAMKHFSAEDNSDGAGAPTFTSVSRTLSMPGAGAASAGAGDASDEE